jgi:hypothetical protein
MPIMLRPPGKAQKVAKEVLRKKGVKVEKPKANEKLKSKGPYLSH